MGSRALQKSEAQRVERCASANLENSVLTTPTGLVAFPRSFADPVFPALASAVSLRQFAVAVVADDWPDSLGEQDGSARYRLVGLLWEGVDPDPHPDDCLSVRQVDGHCWDDRYAQEVQDVYPACLRLPAWAGSQADDLFPAGRSADLHSDADRAERLSDDRSDRVAALDLRAEYSRDASRPGDCSGMAPRTDSGAWFAADPAVVYWQHRDGDLPVDRCLVDRYSADHCLDD